jgi:hypothetical protein
MRNIIILFFVSMLSVKASTQQMKKFALEVNYGLNGNFFVRDYDETGGPGNKTYLYSKNFVGTIGGIEFKFLPTSNSSVSIGYSRSHNNGSKNYSAVINGLNVFIEDFTLRHINEYYQLTYERSIKKSNPNWKFHVGLVIATMKQQEILLENFSNQIVLQERNFQNSKLQEGGVHGGIHWQIPIDQRFLFGIRGRVYYFISTQTLEAITLTPTLSYKL